MTGTPDVRGLVRRERSDIPLPKRRWRTRILLPGAILAVVVALVAIGAWEALAPATQVRVVPVVVKAIAGDAPGSVTVQAPGWIEPDPHAFYVPALTDGFVKEVLVLEGQAVEAGQIVALLIRDDASIERDRAAAVVDERRSATALAEADLEAAQLDIDKLIDRTAELEGARAAVAEVEAERVKLEAVIAAAEAVVLATQDEVDRKSKLTASQAVARGEVERLRLRLRAERAELEAARAGLPVLDARHNAARARLVAAEQHAELLIEERQRLGRAAAQLEITLAATRRAEAELAAAELRLARTEVRAETPGVVLRRLVSPGSRVQVTSEKHSAHVVHLYDPDKLQVRVDVPLADTTQVGIDQEAEIVVDALPDHTFRGVVSRLVHVADIAKNTVEVKVAVAEPTAVLKPEMLARVRFIAHRERQGGGELRQRLFAPRRGVRRGPTGEQVLVVIGLVEGRGRVERRAVTLGGREINGFVEVTDGLRPGDRVIVDAPEDLTNGARVVAIEESPRKERRD